MMFKPRTIKDRQKAIDDHTFDVWINQPKYRMVISFTAMEDVPKQMQKRMENLILKLIPPELKPFDDQKMFSNSKKILDGETITVYLESLAKYDEKRSAAELAKDVARKRRIIRRQNATQRD